MENIDLTERSGRPTERPVRIGLVLSGGGVAGYAFHVAVLAALEAATGFDPRTAEIVVGTSAGAIAGAAIRGDVPPRLLELELLTGLDERDDNSVWQVVGPIPRVLPRLWAGPGAPTMALRELARGRELRPLQLLAALLPEGRSSLTPLVEPIERLHPAGWPARPLWIPATDRSTGERVVLGRDRDLTAEASVADAVLASSALPLYFSPVTIGGRSYIDGGLGSPFNADLLAAGPAPAMDPGLDLDLVIVSAPLSMDRIDPSTPINSTVRAIPKQRLRAELRSIEDGGTETLALEPDRGMVEAMGLNPMDHGRVPAIVDRAAGLVDRALASAPADATGVLERAVETLVSPPDVAFPVR